MTNEQTQLFEPELKWLGQRARRICDLTLPGVVDHLPDFERREFGNNEYLDMIVRQPFRQDRREVAVGSVSKRYFLIQHRQLVHEICDGLSAIRIDPAKVPAELWISDYGERIRLRFRVPQRPFDPGDGYPLLLSAECFNSVEKSCALEIKMSWLRLICMNGLSTKSDALLRKIHDSVWMNRTEPGAFVQEQLENGDAYFKDIKDWVRHHITGDRLVKWVDEVVAPKWTRRAAARVHHICRTGFDGKPVPPRSKGIAPHSWPVSSDKAVPGAPIPAKSLYDVAQALSWVAGHNPTVEDQIRWTDQIHQLITELKQGN